MSKKNLIVIIIFSLIIGFVYNYLNPKGLPIIKEQRVLEFIEEDQIEHPDSNLGADKTELTEEKVEQPADKLSKPSAIKIDKAYQLYKQGVKFIDARMPDEFIEGHIKGAINIPFDGDESYREILKKISKDEPIVTYCSGTECDLSILLGDELFEKGYKKVYIFFGGWNDWLEKGYPISKGEQ